MKKPSKLASGILGIGMALGMANNGCMPSCYEFRQSEQTIEQKLENRRGLIISIEGLQPFSACSCTGLGYRLSEEYGTAFEGSSGNWWTHLNTIKEAYKNKDKIILIGFSAGTEEVWNIANKCKKLNIPIDLMVYLDPTHKNHPGCIIPSNVKEVVNFNGAYSGWFGGRPLRKGDFEGRTKFEDYLIESGHLDLPYQKEVYSILEEKIGEVLNEN